MLAIKSRLHRPGGVGVVASLIGGSLLCIAPCYLRAQSVATPPQGTQTDASFAASFSSNHVTNVFATTQKTSCYTPEVPYSGSLAGTDSGQDDGYTGEALCNNKANTGENLGPYATQNVLNTPVLVKDHSESDLRVDPTNPIT
jgi:hypothetical protein